MKESDVVIIAIPQADNSVKNRPAIILRVMPGFHDFLVCGISTQLHQEIPGFDETIEPDDPDFLGSHLVATSLIRLGFLSVVPQTQIRGAIGSISSDRHRRLLKKLSGYLILKED